jgi:predicted exporter
VTLPGRLPAAARLLPLLLWLLAMALGGVVIARTTFSADLSAFLPVSPDPGQRVLIEQLHNGVAARTLMVGIEGGDALVRAQASTSLAAGLRASGRFEQVHNGESTDWQAAGELLVAHRYQLSPAVGAGRFTAAGLRDAIEETLSLLGTPAGAAVKPLLQRDPTGETQRIAETLIPANAPRSEGGVWVSRQAPRAVLLLSTRAAGADLDGQAAAIAAVREAFAPQVQRGLRLQISGPGVFAVETRARIQREATLLAVVGVFAMGGLLFAAFASWRALAVAMLPVATGVVAGIAAVSLAFGTVHGITLGFGSTLIGEAVDYAIYYLIQARAGGWQRWRVDNWPTVRLGLLTSVCGFAALVFSGFPGLAQLGVFSVAGLVAGALATRYVLPAVVPEGAAGQGLRRGLARLAAKATHSLPRARWVAWGLGALCVVVLVPQWGHLWRGDLASLSPVPRSAQLLDEALRHDLGASDARTLVVANGPDVESALRAAEAAGARLDALVERGTLAGYDSPARLLPSQATQQARLASLPDEAALRAALAAATEGGPLKAERLQPFIQDVQAARDAAPVTPALLAGTPLKPVVDALLFQRSTGGWSALLPLQAGREPVNPAQVRQALDGAAPDIQVVDIKQELDSLYARYLHEALVQALLGGLAVVGVVALQLRSGRRLLSVCQPLLLAVLLTLGGLAAFDVALGILHLVGLLLVVAVGSNYGLFFDQWREGGTPSDDTLASLLLANITTVVAFGLIALSEIPALSAIGRVVAPGALLALLLSAVFARAVARA